MVEPPLSWPACGTFSHARSFLLALQVAAARREAASQASATEAAVQQAREAAGREQAALAAKSAAAEEAAAAARQEADRLRQRRVQEMEELQARFGGLLRVREKERG